MSTPDTLKLKNQELKSLLLSNDATFWEQLARRSRDTTTFEELLFLSTLRRKADSRRLPRQGSTAREKLRLAIIGGYSLYPLHELIEHFLVLADFSCELFIGDYDNYVSEIMDETSDLYSFRPQVVFLLPSDQRCKYQGRLSDPREAQQAQAVEMSLQILGMCRLLNERTNAEVILSNFKLPVGFDLGPYRNRVLGSDWSFRKQVNLELGLNAPACVHICDMEFLEHRRGALNSQDDRAWFESKQPCAADMLVDVAREVAHIISSLHSTSKKVLVLDLDNTLWGGIVGDDGLEGIEIGDTSPRGEAFKAFQKYVLSLTERGVLLAVCSKTDHEKALEPFEKHPEMVLRPQVEMVARISQCLAITASTGQMIKMSVVHSEFRTWHSRLWWPGTTIALLMLFSERTARETSKALSGTFTSLTHTTAAAHGLRPMRHRTIQCNEAQCVQRRPCMYKRQEPARLHGHYCRSRGTRSGRLCGRLRRRVRDVKRSSASINQQSRRDCETVLQLARHRRAAKHQECGQRCDHPIAAELAAASVTVWRVPPRQPHLFSAGWCLQRYWFPSPR